MQWNNATAHDAGFVEVLASERTGAPFGYRLQGTKAGPQLVVAGVCPFAEDVFDRILRIPTLPWIRGTLVLLRLDALDNVSSDLQSLDPLGPVDRTLTLPIHNGEALEAFEVRRSYHQILRTCAELGMIAGRGVAAETQIGTAQ